VGHKTTLNWDVKCFLAANGVRWYNEFLTFLRKEPLGTYDGEKAHGHPLVIAINRACHASNITADEFTEMQHDIEQGFYKSNAFNIPEFLKKIGGSQVIDVPDSLTLREWITVGNARDQTMLSTIFGLQHKVDNVMKELSDLKQEQKKTNRLLEALLTAQGISAEVGEEDNTGAIATRPFDRSPTTTFEQLMGEWTKNKGLVQTMFLYLYYNAEVVYDNIVDKKQNVRSSFARRKKSFDIVKKFASEDLLPYPEDGSEDSTVWRESTIKVLNDSVASLKSFLVTEKLITESENVTLTVLVSKAVRTALKERDMH
jgi:hypothetical protein